MDEPTRRATANSRRLTRAEFRNSRRTIRATLNRRGEQARKNPTRQAKANSARTRRRVTAYICGANSNTPPAAISAASGPDESLAIPYEALVDNGPDENRGVVMTFQ